jgi:transcription-repair coupling factor (superfamily II helicase)
LEIRGAGSLLGAEQSGQMSQVGFDLFAQMLMEAVSEARGEPVVAHPDVRVDLPISAFLPEEYVDAVDERVRIYRRLAGSPSIEAIDQVYREMVERFGAAPEAARNLVDVARIRALAAELKATSVTIARKRLMIAPVHLSDERKGQLQARGAVWIEREKKIALPLGYGESVTTAALGLLDAILA